jgi:class 3 adenylate cyclase/NAD(P)-dependent dehydrogenase (short-subunit alcohol dehydrogenase family)
VEILGQLKLEPNVFSGRIAVVTGAARGIGEQVARYLAHLGAHVIILDIREEGEDTAERIRGNLRSAEFAQIDLRDLDALERFQQETLRSHSGVDILVNNAAKLEFEYFENAPADQWDDIYQTTVRASSFLSRKFLPKMLKNGYGVICNTLAPEAMTYAAHFAAALAGQKSMMLSLAGEVGNDSGVSVFGFVPGIVDTPLVREQNAVIPRFFGMSQEERITKSITIPGYSGTGFERLMPAEHCGASYVYCLVHAKSYHGQIADAFHPLINHGIVTPKPGEERARMPFDNPADTQLQDYIQGLSTQQRNLETRITERTKDLETANQKLAHQAQKFEDVSAKISRYLPRQIYESIFAGEMDVDISSRRKNLTIFFSDLCDFAGKTERLEPEALSKILNHYFSEMTAIARNYGATIDKFIGDAILIFFGDPSTEGPENDAKACVSMAVEMQQRMAVLANKFDSLGLKEPLEMRIGINSGFCTVGNFGSFERIDYTIVGTPVNIASRLQEAGAPGTIAVSRNTHALISDDFACEGIGQLRLKGIADEVDAYRVLFDVTSGSEPEVTSDQQLQAMKSRLDEIEIDKLSIFERDELLKTVSKLLRR